MFGLDTTESLLLVLLLMIIGTGVSRWAARRKVVRIHIDLDHITPVDVQVRAHDLIGAGRFHDAVRLIRKESQVSRRTAMEVANVLRAGEVLPGFPVFDQGDLSDQVRALLAAGSRKQAVFLVRTTEDMSRAEAEAFVDALGGTDDSGARPWSPS
ncbi:hypothetical protein Nocox_00210 [Nonomuraea coxensis DSM 45129]|uniref:Secreted protein n=1 Tax=Nonomuraea coxensis DSM 45129 TaxID=1122611 RepID=A0ABX8TSI3_9ACTN|nr:hypothetical protein [Nonomuraea coxensis]QYC37681.1 hypothetical protein Nocox_00210 [Nonomuraea coxensis DSM 45129]